MTLDIISQFVFRRYKKIEHSAIFPDTWNVFRMIFFRTRERILNIADAKEAQRAVKVYAELKLSFKNFNK